MWKCAICHSEQVDAKNRNKICRRFYITAWILGLGFSSISTMQGFFKDVDNLPRIFLWVSVIGSFVVAFLHIYISNKQLSCTRKSWILHRFILSIVGVALVMCLIAAGTFTVSNPQGFYILCGTLSIFCYVLALIFLSKRLHWEYKRKFVDVYAGIRTRGRRARRVSTISYIRYSGPEITATGYGEYDGQLDMGNSSSPVFQPCMRLFFSNNYNGYSGYNNNHHIPAFPCISLPILRIPTYEEVISETDQTAAYQPPKYTEHNITDSLCTDTSPVQSHAISDEEFPTDLFDMPQTPPPYTEQEDNEPAAS